MLAKHPALARQQARSAAAMLTGHVCSVGSRGSAPARRACHQSRARTPPSPHARRAGSRLETAAAAAASPAGAASPPASASTTPAATSFTFACPICQTTELTVQTEPSLYRPLSCPRCARTFEAAPRYLDLTLTSGAPQRVYEQQSWGGTELFRQPLISYVYERGWRQSFAGSGFPGADREFDMAMRYLRPVLGGTLLDASCGTGLSTRLFARSGRFNGVIALDFSESMLNQAQDFFAADRDPGPRAPIVCVRADIGRLPFATGSLDAVHAGAAIHCWPNPQAALAEISRVLRPGGVFVASTFLTPLAPLGELVGDEVVRPLAQGLNPFGSRSRQYRFWEEAELRELCEAVGLTRFERNRSRSFILFAATKPGGQAAPADDTLTQM